MTLRLSPRGATDPSRDRPALTAALRRHWLIAILLTAGLVLRILAQVAYRPALFYIDSTRYLYHADGNDPAGYRLPLKIITFAASLNAVAAVQHLLGLAMAVLIYLVLIRRGCARWLAALAAAPLLLDAYQLQIEQTVMPDTWFEVLIITGLALLTWRRDAPVWLVAAGAILLGGSATVRQVGEILILPALVGALLATRGWRRRTAYGAVAAAAFAAPIIGYMALAQAVTGHFWLSHSGVTTTYGRMASSADCATLTLPASERPLCPTPAQQASGPDQLEHSPHSPLRPYYRNLPSSEASRLVASFSQHVLHQQPGRVLVSIGRDAVKLFALTRDGAPGDTPIARWQFQAAYPVYPPHASRAVITAAGARLGGGGPTVTRPLAIFLRSYQLHGGFTPGPVYAIALLAALSGSLYALPSLLAPAVAPSSRRRRSSVQAAPRPSASQAGSAGDYRGSATANRRDAGAACLVFFTAAVSVLLMSDLFEFSWRYQLPALVTLIPAGALGLAALWPRFTYRGSPDSA
ncbi:MAG TPA: hypothetical protein VGQ05_06980 [Streptosporangiaceae bacterium]|nr:hypothetical protein [Streptosporangiaceae bacterium]